MKKRKNTWILLMAFLAASILSGCGAKSKEISDAGTVDKGYDEPAVEGTESSMETTAAEGAEEDAAKTEITSCEPDTRVSGPRPQSGLLTAGEWNDNENFDFFQKVLNENEWYQYMEDWNLYPTSRYQVHLITKNQQPAKNVSVQLLSGQQPISWAVTDAKGMAYLYYVPDESRQPEYIIKTGTKEYPVKENRNNIIELPSDVSEESQGKILDLMFVVDTTGSMSDELEFLKAELLDVINQVSRKNSGMKIRLSVNFYRDEGDEYVVRPFPFTEDIEKALSQLNEQYSAGGGDYPEAVDQAMDEAVNHHEWEKDSIKLMFWVLDAPPHKEKAGAAASIGRDVTAAGKMGIHMIPVASSGVDKETEFLLRAMAAMTGGTYTFLTDDSGVGESHLEPTIGQYRVELLNGLLVRLINEYCE